MKSHLKADLPAGVVVFLVALPLCLGIALASGAPLFSGMIAGIVGGLLVGFLSGSHTSVSGPAAGLAAVVLVSIQQLGGSFSAFLVAVVLAGVFQLVIWALKAGAVADYFPSNVIKGMLSAIGIIIILKQIPHALGLDRDVEGDESFLQSDGENTFSEIWLAINNFLHPGATLVAIVSLAILIFWEKPLVAKRVGAIPGALVAVVVSILMNEVFKTFGSPWVVETEHLVKLPVAASFSEFFGQLSFPDFSQITNKRVWFVAATVAAVASIETLLCIEAVDKIDPHRRQSGANREMFAQGIGNIASGLVGGLPITSVIVRSSANINAGAQTRLSSIFHGFLLLVCALFIPTVLNMIPLAALAAVLILVGYKLTKISIFKKFWAAGPYQFWPFIITVVAIVFTDLLMGVGIGLVAAIFSILRNNLQNAYQFHKSEYHVGDVIKMKLSQEVSFLNKASIKNSLDALPEDSKVVIDATDTFYIDHDVRESIDEFVEIIAPEKNIQVSLIGFKDDYKFWNADLVQSAPLDSFKK